MDAVGKYSTWFQAHNDRLTLRGAGIYSTIAGSVRRGYELLVPPGRKAAASALVSAARGALTNKTTEDLCC